MIELKRESYFAKGGQRACYEVPDNPSLCVKVEFTSDKGSRQRVAEELRSHRKVLAREDASTAVALYRGEVETSLGPGCLFDLVREDDGSVSPALSSLKDELSIETKSKLVNEFYQACLQGRYIVGDLHPANLAVQDRKRLVLVDGLGAIRWGWIFEYSKFLHRLKMHRKFRRLCRKIGLSEEELGKSL